MRSEVLRLAAWPVRVKLAVAVLALGLTVGVPWSLTSYEEQHATNVSNYAAYQQRTIDQGLTTREQWDEIARKDAKIREEVCAVMPERCQPPIPTNLLLRLIWVGVATGGAMLLILWPEMVGRLAIAELTRSK